jgi:probable rRNA maturation factor
MPFMLEIIAETKIPTGLRPKLRRVMKFLMKTHQVSSAVCVVLSTDARLRAMKLEFWGEDIATDVLTFPQWEPGDPFMPPVLGDIYISLETAKIQALEHGHDLQTEVIVLVSHGLTHLLGFDHQSKKDWKPFKKMQALALSVL